ncbi:MAG: RNA methyltransferase [Chloroflexota bacterium]
MIISFSNPLIKRIKRLRQRKYREEESAFFVEGLRVVLTAVEHRAPIETLVYSSELLTSEAGRRAVSEQQQRGLPCVELSAPVFRAISEREHPVGLGAIVKTSWHDLDSVVVDPADVWVALVGTADPGNLGTILRTLDAVGAAGLVLVGSTTDPFHPTAVKASMGALFTVPVGRLPDEATLFAWARAHGLFIMATSAKARTLFWDAPYQRPALLLMGSEGEGLSKQVLEAADLAVTIPMRGSASSLNLAVATGLLLYELRRGSLRSFDNDYPSPTLME